MTGRSSNSKTAVDPQDAVEAVAVANAVGAGIVPPAADAPVVETPADVQAWQLPDGHPNLLGKYVTLADGRSGIASNVGVGPTGLGMVELDGTMQHVSNVSEVREPTAKERKAAGV